MSSAFSDASIQQADLCHHLHPMTSQRDLEESGPTLIERGQGIHVYLEDGTEMIDCVSGLACVNIGYGNERVCKAASEAMQQLSYAMTFSGVSNRWAARLSEKLAEITPDPFQRFFFTSIGSDAIESAVKIALLYWRKRGHPKKRLIVSREFAYHGNTIVATSLTGMSHYHDQFGLPLQGVAHHIEAPYWYKNGRHTTREKFGREAAAALAKAIEQLGAENIAAFIGEPIQVAGGNIFPPESYWPEIRRICDENEILLIADEVVTGFGKTGRMFGQETYGFEADLMVMAKGITSGYFPLGAVGLGRSVDESLRSLDEEFEHGFTNCGHPVGAAVALENLAVIEDEGLIEKLRTETGPHLNKRIREFSRYGVVGDAESVGVMAAIELDPPEGHALSDSKRASKVIQDGALANGLLLRGGDRRVGMCLPMITTCEQIDEIVDRLHEVFGKVGA